MKGQDAKGYIAVKKVFKMQLTAINTIKQPESIGKANEKQGRLKDPTEQMVAALCVSPEQCIVFVLRTLSIQC